MFLKLILVKTKTDDTYLVEKHNVVIPLFSEFSVRQIIKFKIELHGTYKNISK